MGAGNAGTAGTVAGLGTTCLALPAFAAWAGLLPHGDIPAAALLCGLAVWIAVVDARSFTIPDAALAVAAALALALRLQDPVVAFDPALGLLGFFLDGAAAGGALLFLREAYYRRHGADGIGFGDVKLAAVGGLLCGLAGFSLALLLASLAALAWVATASILRHRERPVAVPFGAFLMPALVLVWIFGR